MKKTIFIFSIILLLSPGLVFAHGEEIFTEAEELIESRISCDQLTNDQLEIIGDYYMEQMHPGEAHEIMDEIMGGEGSESLKQVHINMARSFYCGEHEAMSSDMMNVIMGRDMMGSDGMMNVTRGNMWPFGWFGMGFGFVFMILFWGLIIGLIVWIITRYTKSR